VKSERRRVLKGAVAVLSASQVPWLPLAHAQKSRRNPRADEGPEAPNVASGVSLLLAPRKALVIGNSAYSFGTLKNPANDARAIAAELKRTGFDVVLGVDLPRSQMFDAIQAYGRAVSQTKAVGLFYFAGHGVQLAWRNYLLPTDATLEKVEDIQAKCVDINALIESIGRAANPMNMIILDACRDNPFAHDGKLEQKGLSQLDAPPGTIIAYATAPGNVASDGEGANGLYTEQLLREILVPEAKIEDVFKRVRLAVRRRSNGLQIPWESTSLEEDFWFIPPRELKRLADEEAERARLEAERAHQAEIERIRSEKAEAERQQELQKLRREQELARQDKLERARQEEEAERRRKAQDADKARLEAELARQAESERMRSEKAEAARQRELDRLRHEDELARQREIERVRRQGEAERARTEEAEQRKREQLAAAAVEALRKRRREEAEKAYDEELALWQRVAAVTEPAPLEDYLRRYPSGHFAELAQVQLDRVLARQGEKKIVIAPQANNPYTQGSASANTDYKVGDTYTYSIKDAISKVVQRTLAQTVTAVTDTQIIYEDGKLITDRLGNTLVGGGRTRTANQFLPGEFFIGKHWGTRFTVNDPLLGPIDRDYQFRISGKENLTVPAGTFECFVIEGSGGGMTRRGAPTTFTEKIWMAPQALRRPIARETRQIKAGRSLGTTELRELFSYKER
jgi:uncharacterized caspase-like protein